MENLSHTLYFRSIGSLLWEQKEKTAIFQRRQKLQKVLCENTKWTTTVEGKKW